MINSSRLLVALTVEECAELLVQVLVGGHVMEEGLGGHGSGGGRQHERQRLHTRAEGRQGSRRCGLGVREEGNDQRFQLWAVSSSGPLSRDFLTETHSRPLCYNDGLDWNPNA